MTRLRLEGQGVAPDSRRSSRRSERPSRSRPAEGADSGSSGRPRRSTRTSRPRSRSGSGFTPTAELGGLQPEHRRTSRRSPSERPPSTDVGGINDDKIIAAIRGGNAPDVALSASADNTGAYLQVRRLDRPRALHRARQGRPQPVPDRPCATTREFDGTRCAMPLLADVYGLYYNKDLLAAGGHHGAPADRPRSSTPMRRSSRSATPTARSTVAGFDADDRASTRTPRPTSPRAGTRNGQTTDGKSAIASDPAWTDLLEWDKNLIDWYGYDKLQALPGRRRRGVLGRRTPSRPGRSR